MKKNLFLVAAALAALVSCTSDEFTGDPNIREANENGAISFNLNVPGVTRAEKTGSEAATDLGNQFIVYGEKSENNDGSVASNGNLVFQNYKVAYSANTAYTTTSNTKDWEYVGQAWTSNEQSHIITSTTDVQTIKYWDYGASSYTFTALSAKQSDISEGTVKITKTTSGSDVYQKGYSIDLAKVGETYPTLKNLYFADRKVITRGDSPGTDRNAVNAYGGNVTFKFRNLVSQIRAGIYETISGYDITAIKFYVSDNNSDSNPDETTDHAFGAICPNTKANQYTGTLTVTYYSNTDGASIENQPKVIASGTPANDLILGNKYNGLSTSNLLGKTSTSPTWDTGDGTFTEVLPQINNTTNLKLKVDYTLWNSVTQEVINVTGATAEIPYQYLQWKPNFKYTYLFKISENTNGSTGQGIVGLYPITFDAIEVVAEDGSAEYITTVSEPSITTFGVKDDVYSTGGADYAAGTNVYAVVEQGSELQTLSASNMLLYTVTTTDATNFPITEASVAEALIEGPTLNSTQADNAKIKLPTTPALTYQNTVPAEDGTTITLHETENKAATFTTATGTKYALVYQKTAATYTVVGSTYTQEQFTAAGTLYTTNQCTTVASSWASGTTYYKRTAVSNKGEYAIKIVTCP